MSDVPPITSARVIVTVLEETVSHAQRRVPAAAIAGKARILGDLVSPVVDEQDWECLK